MQIKENIALKVRKLAVPAEFQEEGQVAGEVEHQEEVVEFQRALQVAPLASLLALVQAGIGLLP